MARFHSTPLPLALAAGLALSLVSGRAAEPPASPPTVAAAPAAASATSAPDAPKRPRAISGDVANMLQQTLPKFAPPPPPPPPPTAAELAKKAEEEAADLRDSDKPQNTIVRLPKYVIREERPPIFSEREIHTKKGLAALAMRRYISDADRALNRWTLPLFGTTAESRALLMYAEDERLKNMSDLADNVNMVMKSDSAAGADVKREAQKTYLRSGDFGYGGMRPK